MRYRNDEGIANKISLLVRHGKYHDNLFSCPLVFFSSAGRARRLQIRIRAAWDESVKPIGWREKGLPGTVKSSVQPVAGDAQNGMA